MIPWLDTRVQVYEQIILLKTDLHKIWEQEHPCQVLKSIITEVTFPSI